MVAMFGLGLKHAIALLLTIAVASGQLLASISSTCGCLGSGNTAIQERSCCVDSTLLDSDGPLCCAANSGGNSCCCCGSERNAKSFSRDCGCRHSSETQVPTRVNYRIYTDENVDCGLVSSFAHLVIAKSCVLVRPADSSCFDGISTQVLLCVWQI
jgi:hypothetical protein